jgi:hypothetical protein
VVKVAVQTFVLLLPTGFTIHSICPLNEGKTEPILSVRKRFVVNEAPIE